MEKILLADDEPVVRSVVQRVLGQSYEVALARDGVEALSTAIVQHPDLILMDVSMPRMDGREALRRLRSDSRTSMIPVIMISGHAGVEDKVESLDIGADDYVAKPFAMPELTARVDSVLRRTRRTLWANPLTSLPGGPAIEEDVRRRLDGRELFSMLYADIDRFKSFNDAYGYVEGDRVIREVAELLRAASARWGAPDDFLGHVGGDDLVLVTRPERAEKVASELGAAFDSAAPGFYSEEDRRRGGVRWMDRRGQTCFSSVMTLSIAIVSNERRSIPHYGKAAAIAAEIKRYLKGRETDRASAYLKDRRTEDG